jgi:hypothetical protein
VQLGTHVPDARVHVPLAPEVKVIMGLQDIQASSAVNASKMCRQAAIVWLQWSILSPEASKSVFPNLLDPSLSCASFMRLT